MFAGLQSLETRRRRARLTCSYKIYLGNFNFNCRTSIWLHGRISSRTVHSLRINPVRPNIGIFKYSSLLRTIEEWYHWLLRCSRVSNTRINITTNWRLCYHVQVYTGVFFRLNGNICSCLCQFASHAIVLWGVVKLWLSVYCSSKCV